jgi:hypothetical protein
MRYSIRTAAFPALSAAVALLVSAAAWAQPVLITAPASITPGQTTITPSGGGAAVPLLTAEITVQGTTLTIDGRHSIASLAITNSGVVTHSPAFQFDYAGDGSDVVFGMHLTTTGDVNIVAGQIDVNGKGSPAGQGTGAGTAGTAGVTFGGGGGHGGSGATYLSGSAGGATYGSFIQPAVHGSGGGSNFYLGNSYAGGAGGGAVRLTVGGTLTVNGTIRANGVFGTTTPQGYASSGSGGSLWLSAATISGNGTIEAQGGFGYGSGGGGRVALYAQAITFAGTTRALPGGSDAGTGTIYRSVTAQTPELIFDGNGKNELSQPLNVTGNLITRNGAFLSHSPGNSSGLSISVSGNANFELGSGIDVTGKGSPGSSGVGAGTDGTVANPFGGGGAHGGSGATYLTGADGGSPFGSYSQPAELGSGGGTNFYQAQSYAGGRGGGAVRLTVNGTLTIAGDVRATGITGTNTPLGYSSAGAGGSIWITAGTLAGAGTIQANGGFGYGSGGGGRVALESQVSTFTGTARALPGGPDAGTGSLYRAVAGQTPELIFDGSGVNKLATPLTVSNANLITRNGAFLTHRAGNAASLSVTVTGNATFETGSGIDVTGAGHAGGQGPGAGADGTNTTSFGGGGAHGGSGERFQGTGAPGGLTHDSYSSPTAFGSGGGSHFYVPNGQSYAGGAGGGAARIEVSGSLTVNGAVRADGVFGTTSPLGYASGGAGGSLWITAGSLAGTGSIQANGAFGYGSGGGGRVAIGASSSTYTGVTRALAGGPAAGTGTVYRAIGLAVPELTYDGSGTNVLSTLHVVGANLVLRNGAFLTHPAGSTAGLTVTVDGDARFEPGAGIDVTGAGFPGSQGPGAGNNGNSTTNWGGGGAYGGRGDSVAGGAQPGEAYGSDSQPTSLGSGGGSYYYTPTGQSYAGGAGGGAVRLRVGGAFTMDGILRSRGLFGASSPQGYASAGSGGSIWLSAGSVSGTGSIDANGTFGYASSGGGRVAVYSCNFTLPPANVRALSGGGFAQPGTVHFATATATISPSIVCATGDITLSVAAVGDTGSIQWRRNGINLTDGPTPSGGEITGSSTTTLLIAHAGSDDDGRYDAFIAGACGGSTSNEAVLTVNTSDFNNDGDFGTDADIEAFFACLGGNCCPICDSPDFDGDTDFGTDRDIETFFRVLGGGGCN